MRTRSAIVIIVVALAAPLHAQQQATVAPPQPAEAMLPVPPLPTIGLPLPHIGLPPAESKHTSPQPANGRGDRLSAEQRRGRQTLPLVFVIPPILDLTQTVATPGAMPSAAPRADVRSSQPASVPDVPRIEVQPEPRPVVAPAAPRSTLYVIPGCYAGNVAPQGNSLPKGCDPAHLTTIVP